MIEQRSMQTIRHVSDVKRTEKVIIGERDRERRNMIQTERDGIGPISMREIKHEKQEY